MERDEPVSRRAIPATTQGIHHGVPGPYDTGSRDAFFVEIGGMTLTRRVVPRCQFADGPPVALLRKWIIQVTRPHPGLYVGTWQRQFRGHQRTRIGASGVTLHGDRYAALPGDGWMCEEEVFEDGE